MSLNKEAFNKAKEILDRLNSRVNEIFEQLELPIENKVQMNHYGKHYLFGHQIDENISDEELINIIKATPSTSWNGHIDFFGKWIEN